MTLKNRAEALRAKAAAVKKMGLMQKAAAAESIANETAALLVDMADTLDNLTAIVEQGGDHG